MKKVKSFKFKLKLKSKEQEITLKKNLGCNRFVWNKSLAIQKERLENKQKLLSWYELDWWKNNFWKKSEEYDFLKEVSSQPLNQTLQMLDRAIWDCLTKKVKGRGFPRFKHKKSDSGFRYPVGVKIKNKQVFLPKIGWVHFFKSQEVIGTPKNATVTYYAGDWFVSIQTEIEREDPVHPSKSSVGIDMGVACFAMPSKGKAIKPKNSFKRYQKRLAEHQRRLAKKKKGSNNRKKQTLKVAKIHKKIKNIRTDFLQYNSTKLCKNHALIVMEDLKVRNMTRSAKGTIENPGKNIKQKSGLNRSILDQGWFSFKTMIEYKMKWFGGKLILVDPKYTSRKCSSCGFESSKNRKNQERFQCGSCGYSANADRNAGRNILEAGHALLACGENPLGISMKQEPLVAKKIA